MTKIRYRCISMAICFLTILFSCRQNVDKKDNVLTDSLISATENIAIGKAKFGISKKEFYQLYPDSLIKLGGNKYIVYPILSKSKELNAVYMVDSTTFENKKFDDVLLSRMDLIKQYFQKTYGSPKIDRGYPQTKKMRNGHAFDACIWEVGKKKIVVGIALEAKKSGNIYYVVSYVDQHK